jgi:hypothetical protein
LLKAFFKLVLHTYKQSNLEKIYRVAQLARYVCTCGHSGGNNDITATKRTSLRHEIREANDDQHALMTFEDTERTAVARTFGAFRFVLLLRQTFWPREQMLLRY